MKDGSEAMVGDNISTSADLTKNASNPSCCTSAMSDASALMRMTGTIECRARR